MSEKFTQAKVEEINRRNARARHIPIVPSQHGDINTLSIEPEQPREIYHNEQELADRVQTWLEQFKDVQAIIVNRPDKKPTTEKGVADFTFPYLGRYIALEFKWGKNDQTDEQVKWQERCERSGGIYRVVRQISEVKALLDAIDLEVAP